MQGSMAAAGSSTSWRRFFLLWMMVMVVSWSTATLAPVTTAAQPPNQMITYTIRSGNVRTHLDFFDRNMRPWAEQNLERVSNYIRNTILCRQTRRHAEVILQLEDTLPPPSDRAYTTGNTIVMNVGFIAASPLFHSVPERVSYFQSTVYHEMTHVWQFLSGYTTKQDQSRGLVEGMADYAAAKGHGDAFLTCQPTADDLWYRGYCHTAKFLLYAEQAGYGGVVCNANLMMKNGYDQQVFRAILMDTDPEDVWKAFLDSLVNPPPPRLDVDHRLISHNLTDGHVVVAAATATY